MGSGARVEAGIDQLMDLELLHPPADGGLITHPPGHELISGDAWRVGAAQPWLEPCRHVKTVEQHAVRRERTPRQERRYHGFGHDPNFQST
jgi:hypothetical protein